MGLSSSLSTALTGLSVSQQSISVLAQNIANANNDSYTRQEVSQSAIAGNDIAGSGVNIEGVTRILDQFVNRSVITRQSSLSQAETINSYYEQTQIIVGQPGSSNSIDSYTQAFFESLQFLSNDTENSSLKLAAVSSATTLTNEISGLAQGLEELRFQADQEIAQSVEIVNTAIDRIFELNIAAGNATSLGQSTNTLADQMEAALATLAEQINITYSYDDIGKISVSTSGGASLLTTTNRSHLSYEAANSSQNFIDDDSLGALTLVRVNSDGTVEEDALTQATLVSAGSKSEITSKLTGGKIQGLIEMRDELLPNIIDQLDNLVSVMRDEMNAIYNNGSSFPPESSLTGTTLIEPTELQNWSGTFLLGAMQIGDSLTDGQPVNSPYASQTNGLAPLEINLSSLTDNAQSAGNVTFQTIIDEINNYYGIPQNAVSIGDLSNIELVSKSDSLEAGTGSLEFNLETTNLSANDRNFTITSITPSDANILVTSPASFPSSSLTSEAGKTQLTSDTNFSLDFSSGLIPSGPYTIEIGISVDDGLGGFYTDTITYTVGERDDGMINDRYAATAVSGLGDATIESPTTTQPILTATLVDADGVEVAKNPITNEYISSGYLKIEGADGVGIAILEQDSAHLGNATNTGTNYGFSHYLGLNNFFVTGDGTDPGQVADSAVTLSIRDDIVDNPGKIAVGSLSQSSQSTDTTAAPVYTFEVSSGSNATILAMNDLATTTISFEAAGGISRTTVSLNNYAAQILGYTATVSANAASEETQQALIYQGFADRKDSISGVNIDEEIANTIIFQNAYAANSRVISVINEMFDDLLAAF